MRAYNACGTSGNTGTITLATNVPPAAPTANAATVITCTSFDANWNASANATSYDIDVATDVGFSAFVAGYNNLNVGNVTTFSVTGLSVGTYYYRMRAENACGISGNSGTITVTTSALPSAPTANAATNIGCTYFDANWTATGTTYYLDVSTVNTFVSFVAGYNNLNVGNVTTYNVTGLGGGTYYYRVRAGNSCGTSGNSNTITVTTTAPTGSQTFSYTGSSQSFVVPLCVTSITIDAKGAKGADGTGQAVGLYGTGGLGARVQSTNVVTPGETIYIYVGGAASGATGGWNGGAVAGADNPYIGGGGGGASDVRRGGTALANRIVAAGGGGGGGSDDGHDVAGESGGNGGHAGLNGVNGSNAVGPGIGIGGGGGTGASGGAAGTGDTPSATAGTLGVGGIGADVHDSSGGGGGGGLYGGGGGGGGSNNGGGAGGGGGSSISTGSGITYTTGFQIGNGQVIITW